MEPISATALAAIAKAVGAEAGKLVARGVKTRVLDERALEKALGRAYEQVQAAHGVRLASYDLNSGFLEHEGAAELAKVLVPGAKPSADTLARRCIDSLGGTLDEDERWEHMTRLRPACKALLEAFTNEIRVEDALAERMARVDQATVSTATSRLAAHLGAAAATADDEQHYLHWVVERNRYLRTVGMVRNHTLQLPLEDVFVGLTARSEEHPGDRARQWFAHEHGKLRRLRETGRLDAADFEAELDRLQVRARIRYDPAPSEAPEQPVLEAVRSHGHLLILGEPGGGKTTLLRHLAYTHARRRTDGDQAALFPVYVRIGDYARSGRRGEGLGGFLPAYLRGLECHTPGLTDLIARRLRSGGCLVLLDGLDEVASAGERRTVVEAVTNFVAAHAGTGNRYVVTSRISGYLAAPLPSPFTAVRLQDMNDATIAGYLHRYCPAVERAEAPRSAPSAVAQAGRREADALAEALRGNPGIRRLAANPLLLTTLVLVHRARGRLPYRRVEAYVEVCDALGRTWRSVQGVPEAGLPDERILTRWLTRLGAWIHEHRPEGSASRIELLEILGPLWSRQHGVDWDPEILRSADPLGTDAGAGVMDFVEKVDRHTGLLVERAPGRYGFTHLTFEEYYAGRDLAFNARTTADRADRIRERLHDPRYREPILLALGLVARDQPEQLDHLVAEAIWPAADRPSRYESLLGRDFLFALRVLADDIPLEITTVDRIITAGVDEMLDGPVGREREAQYRHVRDQALRALKGTPSAVRLTQIVAQRAHRAAELTPHPFLALVRVCGSLTAIPERTSTALRSLMADPGLRLPALDAALEAGMRDEDLVEQALTLEAPATGDDDYRVAFATQLVRQIPENVALEWLRTAHRYDAAALLEVLVDNGVHTEAVVTAAIGMGRRARSSLDLLDVVGPLLRAGLLDETVVDDMLRDAWLAEMAIESFSEALINMHQAGVPAEWLSEPAFRMARSVSLGDHRSSAVVEVLDALSVLPDSLIESLLARPETFGRCDVLALLIGAGVRTSEVVSAATAILVSGKWKPEIDRLARAMGGSGLLTEAATADAIEAILGLGSGNVVAIAQELAVGGEFPSSVVLVVRRIAENSDAHRRAAALALLAGRTPLSDSMVDDAISLMRDPALSWARRIDAAIALLKDGRRSELILGGVAELLLGMDSALMQESMIRRMDPPGADLGKITDALIEVALGDQSFLREQACGAMRNAEYSPTLATGLINLIMTDERGSDAPKLAVNSLVQAVRQRPAAAEEVADRLAELFNGLPADPLPGLRWDLYRALGQIAAIAEART